MLDLNAHTWDEARIKAEIATLLPPELTFFCAVVKGSGYFEAIFSEGDREVWRGSDPFAQMALLNAYGWLITRVSPPSVHGPWGKRRELTLSQVSADALRKARVADPDDLDPEQVQAVYDAVKK